METGLHTQIRIGQRKKASSSILSYILKSISKITRGEAWKGEIAWLNENPQIAQVQRT